MMKNYHDKIVVLNAMLDTLYGEGLLTHIDYYDPNKLLIYRPAKDVSEHIKIIGHIDIKNCKITIY